MTGFRIMAAVLLSGLMAPAYTRVYGKTVKALFLGNSYTYTNNLPQTIAGLALSAGDTLIYDTNTPGGYTLQQHCTNSTTLSLIAAGDWDYVILQEQSQLPSFPDEQVETEVYPYAKRLDSLVKVYNECAKTVFYVTWGRKNGDAMNCDIFPPVCTYEGMDSLLQLRYSIMADSNKALLSPVANVWRSIRTDHPEIELYAADESHPSSEGTFAAACSFYSLLFDKDPSASGFSGTIAEADADIIKHTAKSVVYDSLDRWSEFYPSVTAAFGFTIADGTVLFNNLSENAVAYTWYFGDGNTSIDSSPEHTYGSTGSYEVMLVAQHCSDSDTMTQVIAITTLDIIGVNTAGTIRLYPNPAYTELYIEAPDKIEEVTVSDISGRVIVRYTATGNKLSPVRIEHLSPGTYIVRAAGKTAVFTGRFVKK